MQKHRWTGAPQLPTLTACAAAPNFVNLRRAAAEFFLRLAEFQPNL